MHEAEVGSDPQADGVFWRQVTRRWTMNRKVTTKRLEGFLIIALIVLAWALPVAALGQECQSDEDCPKGMVCAPVPVACAPCAPDESCAPCDAGSGPTGECVESSGVEPGFLTCESDADCPIGFTCEAMELPCGGSDCIPCTCACPADADCPPCECPECPEPEPCTPEVIQVCNWHPEQCKSDADCDAGFECKPIEECTGSGCACPRCACGPCPPDQECPPCDCPDIPCDCADVPSEPECHVIGAWCAPKEQECSSDADCLEGWECVEEPVPCGCPACECPEIVCGPDEECADAAICTCEPCDCADATQKLCLPKGWRDLGYSPAADNPEAAFTGTPKGGGEQNPIAGGQDAAASQPDAAPTPAASQPSSSGSGCSATSANAMGFVTGFLMLLGFLVPAIARRNQRG